MDTPNLQAMIDADPIKGAWISDCGFYRYALWRVWDKWRPTLVVCMLNPSTADGSKDDPTIRRVIGFAKRDHFGGILIINLCAFRDSKPASLNGIHDRFGPLNEFAIHQAARIAGGTSPILVAWGATDIPTMFTEQRLRNVGGELVCLGKTKGGHPRHPLYVRGTQPMEAF